MSIRDDLNKRLLAEVSSWETNSQGQKQQAGITTSRYYSDRIQRDNGTLWKGVDSEKWLVGFGRSDYTFMPPKGFGGRIIGTRGGGYGGSPVQIVGEQGLFRKKRVRIIMKTEDATLADLDGSPWGGKLPPTKTGKAKLLGYLGDGEHLFATWWTGKTVLYEATELPLGKKEKGIAAIKKIALDETKLEPKMLEIAKSLRYRVVHPNMAAELNEQRNQPNLAANSYERKEWLVDLWSQRSFVGWLPLKHGFTGTVRLLCEVKRPEGERILAVSFEGLSSWFNGNGQLKVSGADKSEIAFLESAGGGSSYGTSRSERWSMFLKGSVVGPISSLTQEFGGEVRAEYTKEKQAEVQKGDRIAGVYFDSGELWALWVDKQGEKLGLEKAEAIAEALPGGFLTRRGRRRNWAKEEELHNLDALIRKHISKGLEIF